MAIENRESAQTCGVSDNLRLRYTLRNLSRLLLATLFAITGGSNTSAGVRYPLESNNPPLTSPLQSGTSDELGEELCRQIGLPHLVRTSPSSFICDALSIPVAEEAVIPEPLPGLPLPPPELPREEIPTTYIVQPGDTFSQIIEQQFGFNEAYGMHFRETLFQNEGWLTQKSPTAEKAIAELRLHPDWTPRTNRIAWNLFMKATSLVYPGDRISLEEHPISPEGKIEEMKPTEETTRDKEISQSLPGFFGSGICDESWASQPEGEDVCKTKAPYTQCVQLGSGETPSYTCAKAQIGGRVEGTIEELQGKHFVNDQCSLDFCVGHLEDN